MTDKTRKTPRELAEDTIPNGYQIVEDGTTQEGDIFFAYSRDEHQWMTGMTVDWNVGKPVELFHAVARRVEDD